MTRKFTLKDFFPGVVGTPRQCQLEVFDKLDFLIDNPDLKYYLIDAPVGTGKSAIAMALCKYYENKGRASVILTPMKYLQDQYCDTFGDDLPTLKGRANYACPLPRPPSLDPSFPDLTASTASCAQSGECNESKLKHVICPYYNARNIALSSPYFSSNFRYFFLAKGMIMNGLTKRGDQEHDDDDDDSTVNRSVLIVDEAHTIAEEIVSLMTVTLTKKLVGNIPKHDSVSAYMGFLDTTLSTLSDTLDNLTTQLEKNHNLTLDKLAGVSLSKLNPSVAHIVRSYFQAQAAHGGVKTLIASVKHQKRTWIPKVTTWKDNATVEKVEFVPMYPGEFIPEKLFSGFDKVILLSGTFMNEQEYVKEIGIAQEEYTFIPIAHPFPVANRPVYYEPRIGAMAYNDPGGVIPKIVDYMASLFSGHYPKDRGIVFTVSKTLQDTLLAHFRDRYPAEYTRIIDATPDNKDEALRLHAATPGAIIFTTSLWQGVDLKGDLSRFQIFPKVPYLPFGDPRIKKLVNSAGNWYHIQTAKIICQGYGRSIRAETDYAYTWILDAAFNKMLGNKDALFPPWFIEALRDVSKP